MRGLLSALTVLAVTFTTAQCMTGRVACYYGSWAITRPGIGRYTVDDIPGEFCTHIIYSFVGLEDNRIKILDPELDIEKKNMRNFTSLRLKYPKVKCIVSIGGWNEGGLKYSQMVSQKVNRDIFVESAVEFLNEHEFDGLDLDWEYPGALDRDGQPADKDNFLYMVRELKNAFKYVGKGWELSAAVPLTKPKVAAGYRVPELCEALDAVNVMAYDLRNYLDDFADLHSRLYGSPDDLPDYKYNNVNDGLALWESLGCPANKLVVGLATYGRSYTLPTGSMNYAVGAPINTTVDGGDPGPYTNERSFLAYYEIASVVNKKYSNWTKKWDMYAMCPYAYKGDQWVGYEDTRSITIKLDFVKSKGYMGVMTWAIDMDDFRGICGLKYPLVNLMHRKMSKYTVPPSKTTEKHDTDRTFRQTASKSNRLVG